MKYFGDEYNDWLYTQSKLNDLTLHELFYNGYTEMSKEEYTYLISTPNKMLLQVVKGLKLIRVIAGDKDKYEPIVAEREGFPVEQLKKPAKDNIYS